MKCEKTINEDYVFTLDEILGLLREHIEHTHKGNPHKVEPDVYWRGESVRLVFIKPTN